MKPSLTYGPKLYSNSTKRHLAATMHTVGVGACWCDASVVYNLFFFLLLFRGICFVFFHPFSPDFGFFLFHRSHQWQAKLRPVSSTLLARWLTSSRCFRRAQDVSKLLFGDKPALPSLSGRLTSAYEGCYVYTSPAVYFARGSYCLGVGWNSVGSRYLG